MEQNTLRGLAFAIVFLRAKLAGAAVLKVVFLTPDLYFNIDLGLTALETKKVYKLREN